MLCCINCVFTKSLVVEPSVFGVTTPNLAVLQGHVIADCRMNQNNLNNKIPQKNRPY